VLLVGCREQTGLNHGCQGLGVPLEVDGSVPDTVYCESILLGCQVDFHFVLLLDVMFTFQFLQAPLEHNQFVEAYDKRVTVISWVTINELLQLLVR
jgi:hypothetical protein|tara:strand:- start:31302 stop:31589 length:288 start_codon:yes stop_codon:yes gene_type:complete